MKDGADLERRKRLKNALKRVKEDDLLSTDHLTALWGTSKSRFVTVKKDMEQFPTALPGRGNEQVFPARRALESMLNFEMRAEHEMRAKLERTNAILGRNVIKKNQPMHSVNELVQLNRMATEIEERERAQGQYTPIAESSRIAGEVFSIMSEFVAKLPNKLDPHGLLPPEIRTGIQTHGQEALLQCHKAMRDMLTGNANPGSSSSPPRGARKPRARR